MTVGVCGFCGIGLPRSTQAMRSGGSRCASMSGPSLAVEIETRATPSGCDGG